MIAGKPTDERLLVSEIFDGERSRAPRRDLGTLREPARDVPVYRECDVLVVGGGPSGTAAAVAAARLGAEVVLLERYNHLGGLSTGGLVIWIDRMTDWSGKLVIRGFAEEIMDRLPREAVAGPARKDWGSRDAASAAHWAQRTAAFHGIVTWSPTVDPERLKLASQEIVLEQKVHLVFHCWAALPLLENGRVRGAFFESKAGRQAIRAKVVVDATGDGDDMAFAYLEGLEALVRLIGPITPHVAEEMWARLGHAGLLADAPWPKPDADLLVDETVTVAIQVNGKLRASIEAARDLPKSELEAAALAEPKVVRYLDGKTPRKVIVVPNRIVNVVA